MATFTLSGTGTQAVSSPGSLALVITTLPSLAVAGRANPANRYDVGLLRLGTAHGYLATFPVDADNQLIPCPAGTTIVGYALLHGAVVTIEERTEVPWQGPPGPTGPAGPTGSTGPTGATGATGTTTISDTILSGSAASLDMTSIPGTYTALRLELALRGDLVSQSIIARLRFNGDTGAHYWYTSRTTASTATSSLQAAATTLITLPHAPGASDSVAGEFAFYLIEIPFYSSTVFDKMVQVHGYLPPTGGVNISEMYDVFGTWRDTSAITSIKVEPTSGNFVTGSRALLRGIT